MSDKIWYLKQIDLFSGIPDQEIMKISNQVVERKCRKKELLYSPFDENNSICLLKKGEVTLYHSHYGKKIIIDVLKAGSIFGNISFNQKTNDHFAEVTEEAYICFFSKDDFTKILESKPELTIKFLQIVSDRLQEYENRLKDNLYDAKEKILHQLKLLETNKKNLINRLTGNKPNITHDKLAALTGLSRETVTRAITALRKEGKILYSSDGKILLNKNS